MTAKIMSVCASGRYEIFPTPRRPRAAATPPDPRCRSSPARFGTRRLRVAPWVEEAEDARAAVRLEPDRQGDPFRGRGRGGREQPDRHACDEEDREHHPQGVIVVPGRARLTIEPAEHQRDQAERLSIWLSVCGASRRARYAKAKRLSASLASSDGWKLAGPTMNHARAVDLRPQHEHGGAEHERRGEEGRRDVAEPVVVESRRDRHQDEADECVHGLALEVAPSDRRSRAGRRGGRAVDHDEREPDEPERTNATRR